MEMEDNQEKSMSVLGSIIYAFINESKLPFANVSAVLASILMQGAIAIGVSKQDVIASIEESYDCVEKLISEKNESSNK